MNEQEQLRHWLEDDSCMPFVCNARFGQNILVKSYKSEQIRYLFHQYCYGEEIIQRRSKFDYCGIYFKGDGLIYDADEDFDLVGPELLAPKNRRQMQTDVQSGVRAYINDRVRNNPDNLEISELTDTALIKRVNYFQQQGEHEEAREMFLRGETPEDISFACEYEFSYWDEQNLLDYIHNPVHFIEAAAEEYWSSNQERMLFQFKENEAISNSLKALIARPDSALHRIRLIKEAVERTGAKTVLVTVRKDQKELDVRMDTLTLTRDPGFRYRTWSLPTGDQERFETMFGRNADIKPGDIVKICYRKKTYYEAEPLTDEENS